MRGVDVDGVVRSLLDRGYIEEVGRTEGVGHPIQYGTTRLFLERLGLESLEKLPALADLVPDPGVMEEFEARLAEVVPARHPLRSGPAAPAGAGPARRRPGDPGRGRPGLGRRRRIEPPAEEEVPRPTPATPRRRAAPEGPRPGRARSRRACEDLIEAGRVEVNGEVAALGRRVDPEHDRVTVDGVTVPVRPGSSTTCSTSRPR